jgi:hypothetical protein
MPNLPTGQRLSCLRHLCLVRPLPALARPPVTPFKPALELKATTPLFGAGAASPWHALVEEGQALAIRVSLPVACLYEAVKLPASVSGSIKNSG